MSAMMRSFRDPPARRLTRVTRRIRFDVQRMRAGCGPRCGICGTHVYRGDAVGFAHNRIAHAECALIHWLEASAHDGASANPTARWLSVDPLAGEQEALLQVLLREE
jgi:hypothetical protein